MKIDTISSQLLIVFTNVFVSLTDEVKIPKLILISMDGFRYNFLDHLPSNKISNFAYFMTNGVKTKYVRNVFPSSTFANHMTIVSGLFPESHGIVGNTFWDPYLMDLFDQNNFRQNFESKWFDFGTEPIWVSNYQAGGQRDSGVIMWPGGVAEMKNFMPRVTPGVDLYNFTYSWNSRVDDIVDWFKSNNTNVRPINLGILYFEEPDEIAHKFGPDSGSSVSKEVQEKIFELDQVLGYLKKRLLEAGLFEDMNIIITADHGHTNIGNYSRINLDNYIARKLYTTEGMEMNSLVMNMNPSKETSSEELYKLLKKIPNVTVYRKGTHDIAELHISKNRRVLEFIVEANDGFIIVNNDSIKKITTRGSHGYDPRKVTNMRPFFIASGPAFKKGFISEPFDSVDIYPLMCYILGLTPAPNNGTLLNVQQMLKNPPSNSQGSLFQYSAVTFLIIVIFVALIGGIYSIGAFRQSRITTRKYSQINRNIINHSTYGPSSLLRASDDDVEDDDEF